MKLCGQSVSLPSSPSIVQITLSSVKLCP